MADARIEPDRSLTERRRHRPREPLHVDVRFDGTTNFPEEATPGPVELRLEATNDEGALAEWCGDDWWAIVLQRWGDDEVAVRVEPTPGALFHPILRYQMEMLRRVAPRWRLIGHMFRDDVVDGETLGILATAPYHEIRVFDDRRPSVVDAPRTAFVATCAELFARVRERQNKAGLISPVMVRLPALQDSPKNQSESIADTNSIKLASSAPPAATAVAKIAAKS